MKKIPLRSGPTSRRDFCRRVATVGAMLAAPLIIPSRLRGANAPSNRVRVGHIDCGRIGQGHDMPGVVRSDLAEVVAVCDLDARRVADGAVVIEQLSAGMGVRSGKIDR